MRAEPICSVCSFYSSQTPACVGVTHAGRLVSSASFHCLIQSRCEERGGPHVRSHERRITSLNKNIHSKFFFFFFFVDHINLIRAMSKKKYFMNECRGRMSSMDPLNPPCADSAARGRGGETKRRERRTDLKLLQAELR